MRLSQGSQAPYSLTAWLLPSKCYLSRCSQYPVLCTRARGQAPPQPGRPSVGLYHFTIALFLNLPGPAALTSAGRPPPASSLRLGLWQFFHPWTCDCFYFGVWLVGLFPPRPWYSAAGGREGGRMSARPAPASDKSLDQGLTFNRSQRRSCSATYETLTQNQVVCK